MKEKTSFEGSNILITGGTGSFGRFILKELLKKGANEVHIFSRDEEKQLDLQREIIDDRIKYIIGDVRDKTRITQAMKNIDIVYHAAALKIIPTCENNVTEAIETNIVGTKNVLNAAKYYNVTGVLISTDKAVKPVNLYGMTKGVAEKIWLSRNSEKNNDHFSVVRYGNVVGSRGSIVPYFRKLFSEKKPIPLTDPAMTRFMITLKQAIDLVFRATGNANRIFVPKIPSARIMDIIEAICSKKYPIEIKGIRSGEKVHECLINEYEILCTSYEAPYYIIHRELLEPSKRVLKEEYTSLNERKMKVKEIRNMLKEVPQ